jgi:hypothetical protein
MDEGHHININKKKRFSIYRCTFSVLVAACTPFTAVFIVKDSTWPPFICSIY